MKPTGASTRLPKVWEVRTCRTERCPRPLPRPAHRKTGPTPQSRATRSYATEASLSRPGPDLSKLLQDISASIAAAPFPVSPNLGRHIVVAASTGSSQAATVAICGDARSGAEDLVTVLLDDPLASDQEAGRVVRERRTLVDRSVEVIRIRWGPSTSVDALTGVISVPLDWLRIHNVAVLDLVSPSAPTCVDELASATVPIVLFDDVRRSTTSVSSLLPALGHNPSSLVVVNRLTRPRSDGNIDEDAHLAATTMQLRSSLARSLTRESGLRVPDTLPIDTAQALLALRAFASRSSNSALPAYAASGMTALRAKLESLLTSPESSTRVQDATASRAVAGLTHSWMTAMARVGEADAVLEDFRGRLADLRADARRILEEGVGGGAGHGRVDVGGRQDCERVLGTCLKWWKLPWKVDDVGWYIRNSIDGSYGRSLNQRLAFTSGLLSGTSDQASALVAALLSHRLFSPSSPASSTPFPTAVLANSVSQLTPPPALFSPSLLTPPVSARKVQLLSRGGPVDFLHRRAQLLLAEAVGIGGGTSLIGGFGWTGAWWETATAVGIGTLGWVAAGWRVQGRWTRTQRRLWREWDRVELGLAEDLKAEAEDLMTDKIFRPSTTALTTLTTTARRHREALDAFRQDRLAPLTRAISDRRKEVTSKEARQEGTLDPAFRRESVDQGFQREFKVPASTA